MNYESVIYRSDSIITYQIKFKILQNIIKKYDADWYMNLKQINMEFTVSFSEIDRDFRIFHSIRKWSWYG